MNIQGELYRVNIYRVNYTGLSGGSSSEKSTSNAGDMGLIPGLGRSFEERNGYLLQYSCLEILWAEDPGGLTELTDTNRVTTGVDPQFGVRKLAGNDQGGFGQWLQGAQSVSEVTLVLGSASVTLVQDLSSAGQNSTEGIVYCVSCILNFLLFYITK